MIEFFSENEFQLQREVAITEWLSQIISSEEYVLGELSFVFCNDEFLHRINLEFLNHDTLTDIISFDYSLGKEVHGEIYVSTERVADNAQDLNLEFEEELHRVLAHGVLHLCGYGDKTDDEVTIMRSKENEALKLLKGVK
jgi:rRNA maturation RNase YbeY